MQSVRSRIWTRVVVFISCDDNHYTTGTLMALDASLLNTQHYKVWINGKWSNPGKGVMSSPRPRCSSYWKRGLRVAFDFSRPTYLLDMYIYIYIIKTLTTCPATFLSFFIELLQTKHFFSFYKERNITKPVVNLWFFHFSTYFYNLVRFTKIHHFTTYIYIYIYIYMCVCVCVCVELGSNCSFKHVSLNDKDKFCLYNLLKILSSFLISILVSDWNW